MKSKYSLSKTRIKELAQEEIVHKAHNAWASIKWDPNYLGSDQELEFMREITRQLKRIEKLFGIECTMCGTKTGEWR